MVEKMRTIKQTEVAQAEAVRKEQELIATVIKPADARRQATILEAEASRQATILEAEGRKQSVMVAAEAEQSRREMEGLGEAAAIRARGEAEADAIKAKILAEAEGLRAKLLAEAEGVEKKAEAFARLDQAGKTMLVLDRLPGIVKELGGVMAAIAAPMGNIDKVVLIDGGGSGANGHAGGTVARFAATTPAILFELLQKADALGLDLRGLLGKAGIALAPEGMAPLVVKAPVAAEVIPSSPPPPALPES